MRCSIAISILFSARAAFAAQVTADIATDTTWDVAGSPWQVMNSISVAPGATLTIEPGVAVTFAQDTDLTVEGTLLARGTATRKITISGSSSSAGWWQGIVIVSNDLTTRNTGSILEHVTIEDGGSYYANLAVDFAEVTIRDAVIRNSSADGIYAQNDSILHVFDTSFETNAQYPTHMWDKYEDSDFARLSATGSTIDAVVVESAYYTTGDVTWENPGIPYVFLGDARAEQNATLHIEPGVEVRFEQASGLTVWGRLLAIGTEAEPILLTGTSQTPGWWTGVLFDSQTPAQLEGSRIAHAIIEYGGETDGNIALDRATVSITDSVIRYAGQSGIYILRGEGTVIERCQILNNAQVTALPAAADILNSAGGLILAPNNWWGDANGPTDPTCNPDGSGATLVGPVAYTPFLQGPDEVPSPVAPSDARRLVLEPRRWYAPGDGTTRVWVDLTLLDGNGVPISGRVVRLKTTLGDVVDGGVTDLFGKTLAYLTSDTGGEARLSAQLEYATACEIASSSTATVTFAQFDEADLLPEGEAPYMNSGIEIDPLPMQRGVPVTFRARLTNPGDQPILVDAEFGFAQYGIGLTFGPAGQIADHRIEANSEGVVEVEWTPPVQGHYCVQLQYSARVAAQKAFKQLSSGSSQNNQDIAPGPLGSDNEKQDLARAEEATYWLDKASTVFSIVTNPAGTMVTMITGESFGKILNFNFKAWTNASKALGSDPPRQDYDIFATVETYEYEPLVEGPDQSAARAAAGNAMMDAILDVTGKLRAASLSLDRYAGAAQAEDLLWASQQSAAYLHYKKQAGEAMPIAADRIDDFLQNLRDEGIEDAIVQTSTVADYQNRLSTSGWTQAEIDAAHALGFSDDDLDDILQERIAVDPNEVAGSLMQRLADLSEQLRALGATLQGEANYSANTESQAGGDNLVRVYDIARTVRIGNPLTTTEDIDLRVRRVGVPADWMVSVTPTTVTLAPGEETDATVHVRAGGPAVQGSKPRVAIEGFVGTELVGGVVADVMVPSFAPVGADCSPGAAGAEGDACACPMDCADGLVCAPDGSALACLVPCDPSGPPCPHASQTCSPLPNGGSVCLPPGGAPPEAIAEEDGCGCRGSSPGGLLFLAALALLVRRPRKG